jgi:acyl carrier protein
LNHGTEEFCRLVFDLKKLIVLALRLEDMAPEDIIESDPLFGEGLGLDSIDALELVVALEKQYGVVIADAKVGRRAFASVNALAEFVLEHTAGQESNDAVG